MEFVFSPYEDLGELGIQSEGNVIVTVEGEEQALEQSDVCVGKASQNGEAIRGTVN
jgi:hypothetical protein